MIHLLESNFYILIKIYKSKFDLNILMRYIRIYFIAILPPWRFRQSLNLHLLFLFPFQPYLTTYKSGSNGYKK